MSASRKSVLMSALVGLALIVAGRPAPAMATAPYENDPYVDAYSNTANNFQHTNCWCATAVAQDVLKYIGGGSNESQTLLDDYMKETGKNRLNWLDPQILGYKECNDYLTNDELHPSWANDSRGIAFALWAWTSTGWGYRDYIFGGSAQDNANWNIVLHLRNVDDPAPVTVKGGKHEVLAVGFETTFDPNDGSFAGSGNSILGFNVWDPWYGTPWTWTGWGTNGQGYSGNQFITVSTWNGSIFTKDTHEGNGNQGPYYNKYVTVLRAHGTSDPTALENSNTPSYGTWWYDTYGAGSSNEAVTATTAETTDQPTTYESVADAVAGGLAEYHLFQKPKLASIPRSYSLGTVLHVQSMDPEVPDYEMVEIRAGGAAVAVAIVDDGLNASYSFAELVGLNAGTFLPTPSEMAAAVADAGLHGPGRLVYGPTAEGVMQEMPLLVGADSNGAPAFVEHPGISPLFTPVVP